MKKVKCLVVSGKSNVGKTSSLKELIKIFESKYEKLLSKSYGRRETNDVIVVFLINGYKVGIMTQGDSAGCINNGFNKIGDCDFIIGASHLFGNTVDVYFEHFKSDELFLINKPSLVDPNLFKQENINFAENLEKLVIFYIS